MNTEFIVHPQKAVDYRMNDFNCKIKKNIFGLYYFSDNIWFNYEKYYLKILIKIFNFLFC